MRYELEHRFLWDDPRQLVRLIYTDPALNDALAHMRHLKSREVMDLHVDDEAGHAERRVRIEIDMPIPPAFKRMLPHDRMARLEDRLYWDELSTCDLNTGQIDFEIRLPQLTERVHATGLYRMHPGKRPGEVIRTIRGDVRVDAALVGRVAERIVVSRLKENMDEEARLTAEYLRQRAG